MIKVYIFQSGLNTMNLPQDDILENINRLSDIQEFVIDSNGISAQSYIGDSLERPMQDDIVFGNDTTSVR